MRTKNWNATRDEEIEFEANQAYQELAILKDINQIAGNSENYDEFFGEAEDYIRAMLKVYEEREITQKATDLWNEHVASTM